MKVNKILENEFIQRDNSNITKIATQIASQAAVQFKGPQAKEAAERAANKMYSNMLQTIDDYFNNLTTKNIN